MVSVERGETMRIKTRGVELPPEPPSGFVWRLNGDSWDLLPAKTTTWYAIKADGKFICGYQDRESAERFLPNYQSQGSFAAGVKQWTIEPYESETVDDDGESDN
jgi:hypothetical protein